MIQTQENGGKPNFGLDFWSLGPNSGIQFFFKNLASSVTRCHGQLSSCIKSEKCSADVDRPILKIKFIKHHRLISLF